ncbi:hypothetical protein L1987_76886 [Smallanthus sonchifolius]|uniref:Uncharacterized protein n=1 Tax=Smallanthus sonchifolius TaxID=185202 RepID=A0ACB8Z9G6_9ASTR|nr:hypothetical protein L1987_76886 [Smallanthus sonchifolius]
MSTGDFLNLHPSELKFPFELKKQNSCSFQLTNITDQDIAFKVKTTDPKKYCVRPNTGIILPRSVCGVTVTKQAQKETPSNMECKDKFLVQAVVAPSGTTVKDITADMFNKEDKKVVEECKLRVVYIPVVLIHLFSKKVLLQGLSMEVRVLQGLMFSSDQIVLELKRPTPRNIVSVQTMELSYQAMFAMSQAQKEAPPNMECKDKFLVQAIVTPHGAIVKDIIADMFNKEDEKVVEECKLRVVYVLANPRSPVPEESEEWFSAMAEHGSQSSSRLDVVRTLHNLLHNEVLLYAQKEAPPNMQCIDKFPLQAVVVPNGSTINDIITADMFNKEENKVVEECKLVERRSQSSSRPDVKNPQCGGQFRQSDVPVLHHLFKLIRQLRTLTEPLVNSTQNSSN